METEQKEAKYDISGDPALVEYLASCKSEKTAKGYRTSLTAFFKFIAVSNPDLKFTPSSAIKMTPGELNALVLRYAIHLKKFAKKSADYKRGEISVNSVPYYINPLKSFFDYHDITLSWKKIRRFIPEKVQVKYKVYSREEIRRLLEAANYREKVIILILESSGMRAEAMLDLQIQDFDIIDKEQEIGHFVVYARSPSFYHTFCTPECTRAIKFYLQWRQEMEEELKPTSPLIRDHITFKGSRQAKHPSRISYDRLYQLMLKLLRNANIDRTKGKLQPNHSFRKFLNTTVANAKANPLFKEIMMGHSIRLDNTYYDKNNPESIKALLDEYIKAVDTLTINDEHRLKRKVVELEDKLSKAATSEVVNALQFQLKASMEQQEAMYDFIKADTEEKRAEAWRNVEELRKRMASSSQGRQE